MPSYIILVNWTDQGIKNIKDTIKRAKSFEGAIEKAGGKSLGLYYTLGRYDMVAMVEASNDEAVASVLYSTGSLGNTRTETLRAFVCLTKHYAFSFNGFSDFDIIHFITVFKMFYNGLLFHSFLL